MSDPRLRPSAGLCATCRNARVIEAQTGSVFYRCRLAATDARFAKYPRIPVVRCEGYAARP
jgi:hypothetical protein